MYFIHIYDNYFLVAKLKLPLYLNLLTSILNSHFELPSSPNLPPTSLLPLPHLLSTLNFISPTSNSLDSAFQILLFNLSFYLLISLSHSNFNAVPTEIFSYERTLEALILESNRIQQLPKVTRRRLDYR